MPSLTTSQSQSTSSSSDNQGPTKSNSNMPMSPAVERLIVALKPEYEKLTGAERTEFMSQMSAMAQHVSAAES